MVIARGFGILYLSSDEMELQKAVRRLNSCFIGAQRFDSKQCVTVILDLKFTLAQLCSSLSTEGWSCSKVYFFLGIYLHGTLN